MQNSAQTILITGCSTGIGYCTAMTLKNRGHRVIASARKLEDIEKLIAQGFEAVQLDLADSDSIQVAVKQVLQLTDGKCDVLFNNAAFGQPGAVEDLSREVLRQQFETNFFGTHELTNLLIPVMRKQGHGRIIYNSSVLGLVALTYRGAYNASKFALEGLADTLRLELHGTNIYISLIEPGPILSDFRKNSLALFQQNIQVEDSLHRETYTLMAERLTKEGAAVPFTLPASAVAKKVLHAVEAKKPRCRYYVTFPTYLFGFLKRILSTTWLDYCLRKV
ncbi:MAG: SDR family NAD(P)-dependent oxidoreductase [Methylococcaceae bacterium]|nr:SDR family NAD(P)-dependent oxidoreductase [Methylococcaceae bacterium]